ncbi:iron uptake porin [Leptolyngbya sp. AN03gr2]|uniref:iron uptake porin n=1 Tax=unclassified Leptolyngbya TaxID=2650499 RepID=UPI003D314D44
MTEIGAIALPPQQPPLIAQKQTLQNSVQSVTLPINASVTAPETERSPEFSTVKSDTKEVQPDLDRTTVEPLPSAVPEFSSEGMEQVTSVSQLSDVQPTDWAFQALQSLVERYGCIAGYPDRTFRGNRALTRYEFAAGLNACLDRVQELINAQRSNAVTRQDLDALQKLQTEFSTELAEVKGRVDNLEARTATLEKNHFSTTTRLVGQAIVSTQFSNKADVDLFPRDGTPERRAETKPTLTNNVQISLATSFSGRDLLLTTLQTGNVRSNAPNLSTNMGRLSYESDLDNQLLISDLSYRFPVANNFGVLIGASGVNPSNVFRGINPLEGSGEGTLSLLGQRNPILTIGNGIGGIGFDWQINPRLSLQGLYSAELPSFAGNSNAGGLIGGRYVAGAQLTIAPTNTIDIGIHYLFSRSPDGFLGTGIGDSQLLSPFAPTNSAFTTHAIGGTLAWRLNPKLTIGGWGGWTSSKAIDISGSVQTTNWMVFSAFPDLFVPGNLGGILFGQPPKITSSTLPDGYNFPRFSDTGGRGGQPDTALHLEAFYRARLNSFLDITPGVFVVFNSNHNAANDPIVVGAVRATFRF